MGFSRQEYWGALPYPPPGDLSNPGTEPVSLNSPTLASRFYTTSTTWEVKETSPIAHVQKGSLEVKEGVGMMSTTHKAFSLESEAGARWATG